jgi:IclR family acetate operon transcriptional repressor
MVTVTEVAHDLRLNVSTAYRLLRTLELHRFVQQDGDTAKYRLGMRSLALGHAFLATIELSQIARPTLVRLMETAMETVLLMVLDGDMGLHLDRVESPRRVRVATSIGSREHLHSGAVGKAILAYLPEEQMQQIVRARGLPRFTPNTITDPGTLARHLADVRRAGFAIDDVETEEGVRCVGAPLFDPVGRVTASISVAGPAYRLPMAKLRRLGKVVKAAAQEISIAWSGSAVDRSRGVRVGRPRATQ